MKVALEKYCQKRCSEFDTISEDRKSEIGKIAAYIKYKESDPVNLLFVCTHNSRRSMFGQIWAKVASRYFGFENVETYSGGTEVTEFNGNAVQSLTDTGFDLQVEGKKENPIYHLIFDTLENSAVCFSKLVEDPTNPKQGFGAIMTCNSADKNCPFIHGSELRVALPYIDPKFSDGTEKQLEAYLNTSKQIAIEMLYLFSISK